MVITLRSTMVRPWMVALLVLLTDRRSFGITQPIGRIVEGATADDVDDPVANFTEIASVGCNYKGRSYEPGSLVNTDQPCLKCTCVMGNLVCHLQVCPELPDPPPQGCVIVHKKNKCCAHLQCFYEQFGAVFSKLFSLEIQSRSGPARMENSAIVPFDGLPKGCVINGTIYAEGSAMDSSSLCVYCYCIKGHQQCVRPQCSLTIPGCTAVYKKHTCCPVRYNCTPLNNILIKNTTDPPTAEISSSLSARLKDCRINGRLISLGEPVIGVARSSCETCFCINGQVRCDKVICPPIRTQISPNCGPVYSEGHCCPTSYNCTSNNESVISTTTTTTTTAITSPSTMTTDDNILPSSSPMPSLPSSSPPSVTSTMLVDTENASSVIVDFKNMTDSEMEDTMESRHANPAGLILEEFGGLNVTEKSNNFEMDYDEPTLPPSLPNLKIIPFVAADAVMDEPAAAVYDNYQPVVERVYNVSEVEDPTSLVINSFSPPIETEGGFVPKDPPVGAVYVPDKFSTTTERVTVEPTVHLGHQPTGSVWCLSNGKKYKHGELLTDPSDCDICICFNAKIVCQENCPAVKVGCRRIKDPNNSTCCGHIVCNESENDFTSEHLKVTEMTSESTTTTTQNRDAIIEHIIYTAPSTVKPTLTSTPETVRLATSSKNTPLKPITSSVKLVRTSTPTTENLMTTSAPTTVKLFTTSVPTTVKLVTTSTPTTVKLVTTSTPTTIKSISTSNSTTEKSEISSTTEFNTRIETTASTVSKPQEDEDYSFESMFSFLFSGDTSSEQSSSTSSTPIVNTEAEYRIEHRTDDEIDEKVHSDDVKSQTDYESLTEQLFQTSLNSYVTEYQIPKNQSITKQHSGDKKNIIEPQKVNKPIEVKLVSETEHVDIKPYLEIKQNSDAKVHQEFKEHVNTKTQIEIKPHVKINQYSGSKQQAEVKTHFDVKQNAQGPMQFDFKHHDEIKPYQEFGKHQTEVKSHFDVKEHLEVKPQTNLTKLQFDVKKYPDYKHQTEIKTHFDFKDRTEVKQHVDYQTEVKPHYDFRQTVNVSSQPGIKDYTEFKSNFGTKPPKTKIDGDFNLVASMLKISGCNIYGRMYRVGKIIAELSNPCLECMCTEIGVHCNQLKC